MKTYNIILTRPDHTFITKSIKANDIYEASDYILNTVIIFDEFFIKITIDEVFDQELF